MALASRCHKAASKIATLLVASVLLLNAGTAVSAATVVKAPFPLPALPPMNVRPDTITYSGFDSGAIFATQLQFAFSSIPRAVGLISGVPYLCAQGQLASATECMETPELLSTAVFVAQAKALADTRQIEDLGNLTRQYAYVYASEDDDVVSPLATQMLVDMYNDFGLAKVEKVRAAATQHAWVTSAYGNSCDHLGAPYVNRCGWSFAQDFFSKSFEFMGLPPLKPAPNASSPLAADDPVALRLARNLWRWDQTEYGADVGENSLDSEGYIYIPTACNGSTGAACHLHVHFHGCDQSRTTMGGDAYVRQTQINEIAEANNIIVLYPQAAPNALRYNPMGCWDWFGYVADELNYLQYATREGFQVRFVRMIINDLLSGTLTATRRDGRK